MFWNDGTWLHGAYWGANNIGYGTDGTVSRRYMGPLPVTGQWVRLEAPASQVGLEGSTLNGMAFTVYAGRATWDYAGKASAGSTNSAPVGTNTPPVTVTNAPPTTNPPPVTVTNTPPATNPPTVLSTNGLPGLSAADYATLALPPVGTNSLHVLAPSILELKLI